MHELMEEWGSFLRCRDVNLDCRKEGGMTLLMECAANLGRKGHESAFAIVLLAYGGADVGARDDHGRTALHWALLGADIRSEMESDGKEYPYHDVMEADQYTVTIITALIEVGANLHAQDDFGDRPLKLAAKLGRILELLRAVGLSKKPVDDYADELIRLTDLDNKEASLHCAKRTAVDEGFLEAPSREALAKRRVRVFEADD